MGSFHDDYDYEEFDELRFEDATSARRAPREKHRRSTKSAGRKHKRQTSSHQWDASDWDDMDDFDDYNDLEFDTHYRATMEQ
jgi:hypothetical protein